MTNLSLLSKLLNNISEESLIISEQIISENISNKSILNLISPNNNRGKRRYIKYYPFYDFGSYSFLVIIIISLSVIYLTVFDKKNTSSGNLSSFLSLYNSNILIIIGMMSLLLIVITFYIKRKLNNKFHQTPNIVNIKNIEYSDEVYYIIITTYETLLKLCDERKRQAKSSYNLSIVLIISGVLIIFLGVFFLFNKCIAEGTLASSAGLISNIIGGTILKFYKNTNDRMDLLNKDLVMLNLVKVKYSLILKISDEKLKNDEISKLIIYIEDIKNTGSNTRL